MLKYFDQAMEQSLSGLEKNDGTSGSAYSYIVVGGGWESRQYQPCGWMETSASCPYQLGRTPYAFH